MKGVFKCAMEGDERRFRSVKRSSLGIPMSTHNKYSRRLRRLSLGMPPMHPLLHQQSSVCLSLHYIFITSCVMCFAWSILLFTFLGLFCFLCCSNKLDSNLLFCVGEIHTPLELELLIGFACLFFQLCVVLFLFLAAALFSCSALVFLDFFFCLRMNFL